MTNYEAGLVFWVKSGEWGSHMRALTGGQAKAHPAPQEKQEERNARVARIEVPSDSMAIQAGQRMVLSAIAYDFDDRPIGGVNFTWKSVNQGKDTTTIITPDGEFLADTAGVYQLEVEGAGRIAHSKLRVVGTYEHGKQEPGKIRIKKISSYDEAKETSSLPPLPGQGEKSSHARLSRVTENTGRSVTGKAAGAGGAAPVPFQSTVDGDPYGWNSTNFRSAYNPLNERGQTPGRSTAGGAFSGNYTLSAPLVSLPGRGTDLNLSLIYHSRLWTLNKPDSKITFDIDRDSVAPGWSFNFIRVVNMVDGGALLVNADGTRHSFNGTLVADTEGNRNFWGETNDGSFIRYNVRTSKAGTSESIASATVKLPDGSVIFCSGSDVAGGTGVYNLYPYFIQDANGNVIDIYYYNHGGTLQIKNIIDTIGHVLTFNYDNDHPNLLTSITASGVKDSNGNQTTRVLVRLHYKTINLDYGFSGLTAIVRNSSTSIQVPDAIYYPGTKTGYWFGDADSYSPYGMIRKVSEQHAMNFVDTGLNSQGTINPGSFTRERVYDYPLSRNDSLKDAPAYTSVTETWDGSDTEAAVTRFSTEETGSNRIVTITLPDNTRRVETSDLAPGKVNDGLITKVENYDADGAQPLQTVATTWDSNVTINPRPTQVAITDELNQTSTTTFNYWPATKFGDFNLVKEESHYGYSGELLNKAVKEYETRDSYINDSLAFDDTHLGVRLPNYTKPWVVGLVTSLTMYAGNGTRTSYTAFEYDGYWRNISPDLSKFKTTMAETLFATRHLVNFSTIFINNFQPYWWRGNVTKVTSYATVDSNQLADPYEVSITYDDTGNRIGSLTSGGLRNQYIYNLETQFAYPTSMVSGSSETTSTARVTENATYDFNTGLQLSRTDANGRSTQAVYSPETWRPAKTISSTAAYTLYDINDDTLSYKETTYTDNGTLAQQVTERLNGHGQVRRLEEQTVNGLLNVVETKFDKMNRLWRQTRPFFSNTSQQNLKWSENFYDGLGRVYKRVAPDGSTIQTFYNQKTRPQGASSSPGTTIKIKDAWNRERWGRMNAEGRLVEVVEPNPDGDGSVANGGLLTTYAYDTSGNVIQIVKEEQQRSYRYDSLGRLTAQKLAEASATLDDAGGVASGGNGKWSDVYVYDANSNIKTHIDARGVKASFSFLGADNQPDPLNRLQSVSYDIQQAQNVLPAPTVNYSYMPTNDVTRIYSITTVGVSTEVYDYDSEGRIKEKKITFSNRSAYPLTTDYLYDSLNRTTDIYYPTQYGLPGAQAKIVHHDYEIGSRFSAIKVNGINYASQIAYNADNQATSIYIGGGSPNSRTENYDYDPATGLLSGQQVTPGAPNSTQTPLLNLTYDYTGSNGQRTGQLTEVRNNLDHNKDRIYFYDALGRLSQVRGGALPIWSETYTYDHYGNRKSVTAAGYTSSIEPPASPEPRLPTDQLASKTDIELPENLRESGPTQPVSDTPLRSLQRESAPDSSSLTNHSLSLKNHPSAVRPNAPSTAAPQQVSGNNALALNGTNSYVNVPNSQSINITGPITVEAWVKTNVNGTFFNRVLSRYSENNGGYVLDLYQNKVRFWVLQNVNSADYVTGNTTLLPNTWYHIAGVADGSQLRVYVNGVLDNSKNSTWLPYSSPEPLQIGGVVYGGSFVSLFAFNGLIDEVRISSGSLYTGNFTPKAHLATSANTKALWKFDGQSVQDVSGNANHGTVAGDASFSSNAPIFNSLSLNGASSYATVPNSASLNITGPVTLEAWVKTTNSGLFIQRIISRYTETGGGYILDLYYGKPRMAVLHNVNSLDLVTANAALTPNVWHHVAGVASGSQLSIYVDGVLDSSKPSTFLPSSNTDPVYLGMTVYQGGIYFPFSGLIDEARITGGALYASNFTPQPCLNSSTDTKALWKFDGQGVLDVSSNANHGTLAGPAAYSADTPASKAPQVSLLGPSAGTLILPSSNVTLSANATDSDGTISKVEFYSGDTLLGSATTSPYTVTWINPKSGTPALTAKAIDDQEVSATSASVSIKIDAAPSVNLTSPANNGTFSASSNLTLAASAADIDGTISKVEFYNGTTLLGTATTSPYSVQWSNLAAGHYTLTAKATDDVGAVTVSSPVAINVTPPNQPPVANSGGPYTGTLGAAIEFNGSASSDADGTVNSYLWDFGDAKAGSGSSPSHIYKEAGTYTVKLTVTDNNGLTATATTSATVQKLAAENGAWANAVGARASGGMLTDIASDGWGNAGASSTRAMTPGDGYVEFIADQNNKARMCGLSDKDVDQNYPSITYALSLGADGNVNIYEKGVAKASVGSYAAGDKFRIGVEGGAVKYRKNGMLLYTSALAPTFPLLVDTALSSNGASISNTVIAGNLQYAPSNAAPVVNLSSPANGEVFTAPANILLTVDTSDGNGFVTSVNYYNGPTLIYTQGLATLIGQDFRTYMYEWHNVPVGTYTLSAQGRDNLGAITTSNSVTITVKAQNQPPVARTGGPYTLTKGVAATFNGNLSSDPDGSITSYLWNFGDNSTGTGSNPQHTYNSPGTYRVTLTVTDNDGAQAVATTNATVTGIPIPSDGWASLSYDSTTNRINTTGFLYDAAGNLTRAKRADGVWQQFQYDAAGRLVKVKNDASQTLETYTYGYSRSRLMTQYGDESSSLFTYYIWSDGGIMAEYYSDAVQPSFLVWTRNYIYLGDTLLATQESASGAELVQFHHPDLVGTRLVSTPASGTSFEQTTLPFGTSLDAESTGATGRRFTSYDRDSMVGLDYAMNRYYDPAQGRFTQVDPIGMQAVDPFNPQSLNLYSYVGNDPINNTDSTGLDGNGFSIIFFPPFIGGDHGGSSGGGHPILSGLGSFFVGLFGSLFGGHGGPVVTHIIGTPFLTSRNQPFIFTPQPGVYSSPSAPVITTTTSVSSTYTMSSEKVSGTSAAEKHSMAHRVSFTEAQQVGFCSTTICGPYIFPNPFSLIGQKKRGDGDCAQLVQYAAGLPLTRYWVEGEQVLGNYSIEVGTAIATFENGFYPNKPSGNHAAFYLGQDANGIWVVDQWKSLPAIHRRYIRIKPDKTDPSNNARAFSVIYTRKPQ